MTITSSDYRNAYAGNGSTTVFAYSFEIADSSHLTVTLVSSAGVETTQTLTSEYTVSGVGNPGGGNVTMTTAPASGEKLVITRNQPFQQNTDYVTGSAFSAETHEEALDELTMNDIQQNEVLSRAVKAPLQDGAIADLPRVADRANKVFSFDGNGDPSSTITTDSITEVLASVTTTSIETIWATVGATPTRTGDITFTVPGDLSSTFSVGTKLRLTDTSTLFGIVTDVAYTSLTTVTVLATGALSSSLSSVEYSLTSDTGQTKGLVLDARTYVVPASRTITNDFVIPKGCLINISASQTLTISGSIDAGIYQIFSGSGVVRGFDAPVYYPQWWGAVADAELVSPWSGTDNYEAFQALADFTAAQDYGHVLIPPGIYAIKRTVRWYSNNLLIEGYGAIILHNGHTSAANVVYYRNDGFRIGRKELEDGGTKDEDSDNPEGGPYIKTINTHVKGLSFRNCRIALWFVHCQGCSSEDISSDSVATIACGNDGADQCDEMLIKNTYQLSWASVNPTDYTGFLPKSGDIFYEVGFFQTNNSIIDGVFNSPDCAHKGSAVNVNFITIANSDENIIENINVDGIDSPPIIRAVDIIGDSQYNVLRNGFAKNCSAGVIFFGFPDGKGHAAQNMVFKDCLTSINTALGFCVVENCRSINPTNEDLVISTNAGRNIFRNNIFEGNTVTEESPGGLRLHAWDNNIGGPVDQIKAYTGIDGFFPYTPRGAYAFYLGPQSGITGAGAYATLSSFTGGGLRNEAGYFDTSTGVYTLPSVGVGGIFECKCAILLVGFTAAATVVELYINVAGARRLLDYHQSYGTTHGVSQCWLKGDLTTTLGAGGTIKFEVRVQGEANDTIIGTAGSLGYVSITEQMGY